MDSGGAVGAVGESRFEKSLGLLTSKFVALLQSAQGGVLDLKVVSDLDLPPRCLWCLDSSVSPLRPRTP